MSISAPARAYTPGYGTTTWQGPDGGIRSQRNPTPIHYTSSSAGPSLGEFISDSSIPAYKKVLTFSVTAVGGGTVAAAGGGATGEYGVMVCGLIAVALGIIGCVGSAIAASNQ